MLPTVSEQAPADPVATEYDRRHLPLYAGLLDAAAVEEDWRVSAARLMGIDIEGDGAHRCYLSHLERARWIVGEGLASAITVFGRQD